ncbi:hypothetical protein RB195_008638 [Necator americanus]
MSALKLCVLLGTLSLVVSLSSRETSESCYRSCTEMGSRVCLKTRCPEKVYQCFTRCYKLETEECFIKCKRRVWYRSEYLCKIQCQSRM